MKLHPAVQKYISQRNSLAAKARWKGVSAEKRTKIMKKVRSHKVDIKSKPWDIKGKRG